MGLRYIAELFSVEFAGKSFSLGNPSKGTTCQVLAHGQMKFIEFIV